MQISKGTGVSIVMASNGDPIPDSLKSSCTTPREITYTYCVCDPSTCVGTTSSTNTSTHVITTATRSCSSEVISTCSVSYSYKCESGYTGSPTSSSSTACKKSGPIYCTTQGYYTKNTSTGECIKCPSEHITSPNGCKPDMTQPYCDQGYYFNASTNQCLACPAIGDATGAGPGGVPINSKTSCWIPVDKEIHDEKGTFKFITGNRSYYQQNNYCGYEE
ncbi:MAG: hypothetical protein MJ187_04475 [Alphaproteobacteria bacterium]|nr:hypothetical protein [Alphaproteobacteria bacterium]